MQATSMPPPPIEPVTPVHAHAEHSQGLLLIGLFKLGKAALFVAIGIGALKLLHQDLSDVLLRVASHLRFDTESHFITLLLEKAELINDHRLREISLATFAYSALALTEGIGLLLEKTWAEYLTLVLSLSFLPWEVYELIRRVTAWRVGLTVVNIIVIAYLLWFLWDKRRKREERLV